jgi:hypothetical protein
MALLTSKGAGMAYPHETDESGVVIRKNVNADNQAGDPEEQVAVTGRENDLGSVTNDYPVKNTTFADRKAMSSAQTENKAVSASKTKAELLEEAARRGVQADESMTKQEIVDAINAG